MKSIRPFFHPAWILTIGLTASQVVFSFVVYASNKSLYATLLSIKDAGYLIVPNPHIMDTLLEPAPAFYGGMFFSLTAGLGVTWMTLVLILIWILFPSRKKLLIPICVLWGAVILLTNINGINVPASSAMIIIPAVVAYAGLAVFNQKDARLYLKIILTHVIVVFLVFLTWIPHLNSDTFISIRDYLLLGNSLGTKVNDFYYRYTMYPVEVFKPVDQKVLKTSVLKINDDQLREIVKNKLRGLDYLAIEEDLPSDVTVIQENQRLVFLRGQKKIIASTPGAFLSDPDSIMTDFSDRCDINKFFRKTTFMSLLLGLPITIYVLIHSALMLLLFFIPSTKWRFIGASALSLVIGASAFFPLYNSFSTPLPKTEIIEHLGEEDWQIRAAALKRISDDAMEIDHFMDQIKYGDFKHIPEKYWFARGLSQSRNKNAISILYGYLEDPNPNVVCMALYSLGKLKHLESAERIIELINTSPHWYVQWYAYKALRRIGWTQPKPL
ncbi:MAG: HEAT repeat domain-containing protein [Desulfobacterales bacterium]|nr:HEAT repeat domain-containing protein [Desulfobacterales bacterium]